MKLVEAFCRRLLLAFALAVPASAAIAASPATWVTWYGQSAFVVKTPKGHVLLFDPWFANTMNPAGDKVADALERVDLILVSHGHFDHVGAAASIARRTRARLVATLDLGMALARYGGFPKDNMGFDSLGNAGGVMSFFDGEVQVLLVPAVHSSHVSAKDLGVGDDDETHWGGNASGFVVKIAGGPTIYHTGDTDLFDDMALVRKFAPIDLMLVCIGDHFTMGSARAADAVGRVAPAQVVPMHYGTFLPMMTGTPQAFRSELGARGLEGKYLPLKVGEARMF